MQTEKGASTAKPSKASRQRGTPIKMPVFCIKKMTRVLEAQKSSRLAVQSLLSCPTRMQAQMQRIFAAEFPHIDLATVFVNVVKQSDISPELSVTERNASVMAVSHLLPEAAAQVPVAEVAVAAE